MKITNTLLNISIGFLAMLLVNMLITLFYQELAFITVLNLIYLKRFIACLWGFYAGVELIWWAVHRFQLNEE